MKEEAYFGIAQLASPNYKRVLAMSNGLIPAGIAKIRGDKVVGSSAKGGRLGVSLPQPKARDCRVALARRPPLPPHRCIKQARAASHILNYWNMRCPLSNMRAS